MFLFLENLKHIIAQISNITHTIWNYKINQRQTVIELQKNVEDEEGITQKMVKSFWERVSVGEEDYLEQVTSKRNFNVPEFL